MAQKTYGGLITPSLKIMNRDILYSLHDNQRRRSRAAAEINVRRSRVIEIIFYCPVSGGGLEFRTGSCQNHLRELLVLSTVVSSIVPRLPSLQISNYWEERKFFSRQNRDLHTSQSVCSEQRWPSSNCVSKSFRRRCENPLYLVLCCAAFLKIHVISELRTQRKKGLNN